MTSTVIAGYDQSAPSEQALLLAAREADWRHVGLTVVHAYHYARPTTPMVFTPPVLQDVYAKAAMDIAEQGVEHVRARFPGLDARPRAEAGPAAAVLADASRDAELLVVGNRGRGGFAGLLLGSVSMRALGDAGCPVIVARGGESGQHDRIVVALDIDDPSCLDVLAFAVDEAAVRRAELVAVHAWDDEEPWIMDEALEAAGLTKTTAQVLAELDSLLAAHLRRATERHPGIKASHRIASGPPGKVMVQESSHADLVITGAHWRDPEDKEHRGIRVGAITVTLLHHAECPVAVVPHD